MSDAGELRHDDDCLVITIDIVDCPMAEIQLTEVFDVPTRTLLDIYHDVIRDSVLHRGLHPRTLSVAMPELVRDALRRHGWGSQICEA